MGASGGGLLFPGPRLTLPFPLLEWLAKPPERGSRSAFSRPFQEVLSQAGFPVASSRSGTPGNDYARYAGLGVQFAGTLVVFGAIGWWVDGKLGTEPWLMIAGIFLGFFGAMISIVKQVPPPSKPSTTKKPTTTKDQTTKR